MGISVIGGSAGGTTNKEYKEQVFKTSGTWTYPTSSNFDGQVEVMLVGGGGASGGAAGRSLNSDYTFAGGGGGGQVILSKKLNVLGLGNQSVRVGNGGGYYYQQGGGLFGGCSRFGNNVIYNYYPNPSLSLGLLRMQVFALQTYPYPETYQDSAYSSYTYGAWNSVSSDWASRSFTSAPPIGKTFWYYNQPQDYGVYTRIFEIDPSINYTLSFYVNRYGTTGASINVRVFWYDETGENLSNNLYSNVFTTPTSYSWAQVSLNLTTAAPSTARYARLCFYPSSGTGGWAMNGLCFSPTSLSVSAPINGETTGYTWGGSPDNSPTIINNNSGYIAQGGGGGWGYGLKNGNSQQYIYPGWSAFTSGGISYYGGSSPASTDFYGSGCGGGAGGDAELAYMISNYSYATNYAYAGGDSSSTQGIDYLTGDAVYATGPYASQTMVAGGIGGESFNYFMTQGYNNQAVWSAGSPGEGIEGYGCGGIGAFLSGNVNFNSYNDPIRKRRQTRKSVTRVQPDESKKISFSDLTQNTGNGANGFYASQSGTFNQTYAQNPGATGLVIVRWYE